MTRTLSIWTAVLALLVGTAGVFAQSTGNERPDPADVAARRVAAMEGAADRAIDGIAATTGRVVDRVARLDAAGASDREIILAGRLGVERVQTIGRFGAMGVTRIESHCVQVLRRLGADRALIGRVMNAAEGFREDIGTAVRRGSGAIRQAVADAIG